MEATLKGAAERRRRRRRSWGEVAQCAQFYAHLHIANSKAMNGKTNPRYANTHLDPAYMWTENHTTVRHKRIVFKIETQQRIVTLITSLGKKHTHTFTCTQSHTKVLITPKHKPNPWIINMFLRRDNQEATNEYPKKKKFNGWWEPAKKSKKKQINK